MASASRPKTIPTTWHFKGTRKAINREVKFENVDKSFKEVLAGFQHVFNLLFKCSNITLTHFEELDRTVLQKDMTVSVIE